MSRPFTLRDADFNVVPFALGSAPLLNALARPGLDRIDIWPQGPRKCTIGFAWADGATAIGDLPWVHGAAVAWLQQRGVGRIVREHLTRNKGA